MVHRVHTEVKGQLAGGSSALPSSAFRGASNSVCESQQCVLTSRHGGPLSLSEVKLGCL